DRGGRLARAAVEVRPGAVVALPRADPARRVGGVLAGADAEELAQQQVLGVDGDVRLQLGLPGALGGAEADHVLARGVQGELGIGRGHQKSRAVMKRAMSVSSARTSVGMAASVRWRSATVRWRSASVSAQARPPASSMSSAAWRSSS